MDKKDSATPEMLRQLLHYEPETGRIFWLPRSAEMFASARAFKAWTSNFSGKEAFTSSQSKGYKRGTVFGQHYLAHRIAWAIHYGEWPDCEIDHINCDKKDNRITNLRLASRVQNMANVGVKSSNRCGFKGVTYHPQSGKWRARIDDSGKSNSLGLFLTPQEAHGAYCAAAQWLKGEFARIS